MILLRFEKSLQKGKDIENDIKFDVLLDISVSLV